MRSLLIVIVVSLAWTPAFASTEPPQAPQVSTFKAAHEELYEQLTYPARVESRVNANILSEADGVVTRILSPLGAQVAKNQAILEIRNTDPVYDYAPLVVRASVAGIVSQVLPDVGSRVQRGDLVARVTDPLKLRISIEVAAIDLPRFKKGLQGELELPGQIKPVTVEVAGVSAFVDPATGTAVAELKLPARTPAETSGLLPGQIGKARFKTNLRKGFSIPDHAIVYKGGESVVRLVVEGKAKHVPVKIGRKQQGRTEIVEGLNEGDQVIDRAAGYIRDGQEVKVPKPSNETKS